MVERLGNLYDGSSNDALLFNAGTPGKSVLREDSLAFMRARVDTPVDSGLGNECDIKPCIDIPRELAVSGSFVIGTTW